MAQFQRAPLVPHLPYTSLDFRSHRRFIAAARSFATAPGATSHHQDEASVKASEPPQAYPLSGYYSDILSSPQAYRKHSTRTVTPSNSFSSSSVRPSTTLQSPADKMSIVFGSRLAGPGNRSTRYDPFTMPPVSTWKTVDGMRIPPRPTEPDNCCMSGCAHCVWDDFREDMEAWAARVLEARVREVFSVQGDAQQDRRPEVDSSSTSMDDDGGGSETNWSAPSATDDVLFAGIPVGIREFMKTEKRLRDKHRREQGLA